MSAQVPAFKRISNQKRKHEILLFLHVFPLSSFYTYLGAGHEGERNLILLHASMAQPTREMEHQKYHESIKNLSC
jgi:hypothetical protein